MRVCADKILNILKYGDIEEKRTAIEVLSEFRCSSLVEALVEALVDKNLSVRKSALKALEKMDQEKVKKAIEKYRSFISSTFTKDLENSHWPTRSFAARILGKIGEKNALAPLVNALGDTEGYVRYFAAEALGRLGDSSVIPNLVDVIVDENGNVRNYVIDTIKSLLENFPDIPTPQEIAMLNLSFKKLQKCNSPCVKDLSGIIDKVLREKTIQKTKDIIIIDLPEAKDKDVEIIEI